MRGTLTRLRREVKKFILGFNEVPMGGQKGGGDVMQQIGRTGASRKKFGTRAKASFAIAIALTLSAGLTTISGASGGKTTAAEIDAAKAFVAAHSPYLTANSTPTTPIPSKPPKNKTIVYVETTDSGSLLYGQAIQAAAKILGWKVDIIPTQSTAEAISTSMSLALEKHPSVVMTGAAFPEATFPTQLAALKKAGIPYIECCTGDPIGNGVTANIDPTADFTLRGVWLAHWVVANSNGKANVAIYNLPTYPVLNAVATGLTSTFKSTCPGCTYTSQNIAVTSIGTTLPAQVVSYLRAHPSVNYVAFTFGDMTLGLSTALKAAGLSSKVKVVTQHASKANLQDIADGSEAVNLPEPDLQIGWYMVDAAIRALEKAPVPNNQYEYVPENFITKANLKSVNAPYVSDPNYKSEFLRLWKLG
jgi:ribose transport system substrate-binding protein